MEGILIAIISGLFGLAGIFLNNYLRERKKAKPIPQPSVPKQRAKTKVTPSKQESPIVGIPRKEESKRAVFFRMPSWWALTSVVMAVSIGAAFLARWIIEYGLSVLNIASPDVVCGWLALGLGGMVWGIAYIIAGTENADDVVECLFGLFGPYEELFGPISPGDFLYGLLSALPINFLLSWGSAVGLGALGATQVGANLSGVVYLVFGCLTFTGIVWFLSEEL